MKNHSVKKWFVRNVATVSMLVLPVLTFAQDDNPGSPTSPNPDQNNPLAVPFDSNMTCMFLLIAAFFAFIVIKKVKQKKSEAAVNSK
ncbi:hypothetical protein [Ferruginibacter albus]|uniref:hypothetical protein n=1 Tax=Ferruginibacter albus TaxID=2875540 RepID=UPI001CC71578|nr:hypothetical protein [Ferruginibacter albus]UAY51312.1 hypothetical protein K9M53_12010 [Ferruginibacter albus]